MAKRTQIPPRTPWARKASFEFHPEQYPEHPGCYLMYDAADHMVYVGKAKNLRRRLSSYFRMSANPHRRAEMIRRIHRIELFLVRNEREALVLESNLIRHHQPTYNSRFTHKGDSYYYIALSAEAFPRFVPYRRERANYALSGLDGKHTELFGPYVGWRLRNRLLEAMRDLFPVRTCHALPQEPCARAASGACLVPCDGRISRDQYRMVVQEASRFLRRPPVQAIREARIGMDECAALQDYDEATVLRDRVRALEHAALPQVVELERRINQDVLWMQDRFLTTMSVRSGATVSLCFSGPNEQNAAQPLESTHSMDHVVTNAQACEMLLSQSFLEAGIDIPRTRHSRSGQLLEICRLNHAYRLHGPS